MKGVDDTNISKNREQVIIWFSADYGAEQQKRDKAKKKHAIDVVIVVQWNNHGNDIKKDWTEDFIDDFPDKEEDDDYDGDDKSH